MDQVVLWRATRKASSRTDGTCIVEVDHGTLGLCLLTFSVMSHLTLPRKQSWGRSVSINSFSMPSSGRYEIEAQSGDLIIIEASEMILTTSVIGPGFF